MANVKTLGSTSKHTIGRNKSGNDWKKGSKRASMCKSTRKGNYEIRMAERAKLKELQERSRELKRRIFQKKVADAQRRREKAERKKLNTMKSAKIQTVSLQSRPSS